MVEIYPKQGEFMNRVPAQVFYDGPSASASADTIANEAMLASIYPVVAPLDSWRYEFVKRACDVALAASMLAVLAVPGALIACAVALTSKGGVFYRERRIGRYGQAFNILKFRSMHKNAEHTARAATRRQNGNILPFRMRKHLFDIDPRITVVGRFLRSWSLDELPQLLNVLRGDMSLIGPRPIIASETASYEQWLPYYFAVKPGLSGLWQVSGRSNIDYPMRAEIDATYVKGWSLRNDLLIVFRTIPAVLRRTGAY